MYFKKLDEYLKQKNQVFICTDNKETLKASFDLLNGIGLPCNAKELKLLQKLSRDEYENIKMLYESYNGIDFQVHDKTIGLRIAPVQELKEINKWWKDWFSGCNKDELVLIPDKQ